MPASVYIGIGSNLGDPVATVLKAWDCLGRLPLTTAIALSSLYCSKPMGPQGQPDYINAVAGLATALAPMALLDELQRIENDHGRQRVGHLWGPRTLDLDILVYADKMMSTRRLSLPHPGITARAFVLVPLHEIAPALEIPGHGPVATWAARCDSSSLQQVDAPGHHT